MWALNEQPKFRKLVCIGANYILSKSVHIICTTTHSKHWSTHMRIWCHLWIAFLVTVCISALEIDKWYEIQVRYTSWLIVMKFGCELLLISYVNTNFFSYDSFHEFYTVTSDFSCTLNALSWWWLYEWCCDLLRVGSATGIYILGCSQWNTCMPQMLPWLLSDLFHGYYYMGVALIALSGSCMHTGL